MNHTGRWRLGALASAVALLGSLASLEAHAVALGRITVQSALGESLRAEIEVSDLSAEEASSLRIGVAGAEVFKSAGLEYSAAAAGIDVRIQKRADGRSFLRLSSNRAVTDPFVDLILEARWASGRVTRDYTMLFDPPKLRGSGAGIVASAPVLPRETVTNLALPSRPETPAAISQPPARAVAPPPRPAVAIVSPVEKVSGVRQVTVKPGDNASKIAIQNKPVSVSLDQMLVALLRSNPEAFVGGNINLIKSGAVVEIPDERAASALSSSEARKTLVAQSSDFNTFRRKLADGAPAAARPDSADQQASGKIQARVDDRAQAVIFPDKLTLSKGAVQGMQSGEPSAKDIANRPADLPQNSSGINSPAALPGTTTASAPGTAAPLPSPTANPMPGGTGAISAAPGAAVPLPNIPGTSAASVPPVSGAEQAPVAPTLQPAPNASAPAASQVPAANQQSILITPPVAPATPSLIDWIFDNSILLGGGALLALLAGLGIVGYRKSQKSNQMDSSFLDSRLQPNSIFGASGGQRVDTSASIAGGSSIAYSPSQLDAAGDVDPVAEADVYLAYGRDQQAEDILKEALRTSPARIAIHAKLLEIFAKRRDNKAFESVALTAFKLTGGQGSEWVYISQLGRQLEPGNSLYQSGNEHSEWRAAKSSSGLVPLNSGPAQRSPATASALDFDLDLESEFVLDELPVAPTMPARLAAAASTQPSPLSASRADTATPSAFMDLDLNLDDAPAALVAASPLRGGDSHPARSPSPELDFLAAGLDFTPELPITGKTAAAPPPPVNHHGMLEFDLNSLSLDLGPSIQPSASALAEQENDPLEIKFLLAEEFRILGDSDGARSLADEVVAKAKGSLKSKAQAFLNSLS